MHNILEIKQLSKHFNGTKAVDNVSFSIEKETITTIIGPNGAGKTTLFNIINGFIPQDTGNIYYEGSRIDGLNACNRALIGIGRLWQDVRLFENMTVLDNLLVAPKKQLGEKLINSLFKFKVGHNLEKDNHEKAIEILEFIHLQDKAHSLAQNLSYGQQKLLAIGRLLMNDAKLLLLDEPLAGLNPKMIDSILEIVRKIVSLRKTVLMIEHNVHKAKVISDKIIVMDEGKVEFIGSPMEVFLNPQLKEVYLGV